MSYIRVRDGARIYVRTLGKGEPVVLLHGFGSHSGHWLPYAMPLATRYRFILPDMRGFGASHRVNINQDCLLTNYCQDLDDILDHYGVDKVALGGISMGACTSMRYHQMTGFERVSRYLHIDQSPCIHNEDGWTHGLFGIHQANEFERLAKLLAAVEAHPRTTGFEALPAVLRRQLIRAMARFLRYAFYRSHHKAIVNGLSSIEPVATRLLPMQNWWAYMDVLRAYLQQGYDMRDSMQAVDIPMTVMVGMHSTMYPADGQIYLHKKVPHSRLIRFERSGHAPIVDQPLQFFRGLRGFLAEPALSPA